MKNMVVCKLLRLKFAHLTLFSQLCSHYATSFSYRYFRLGFERRSHWNLRLSAYGTGRSLVCATHVEQRPMVRFCDRNRGLRERHYLCSHRRTWHEFYHGLDYTASHAVCIAAVWQRDAHALRAVLLQKQSHKEDARERQQERDAYPQRRDCLFSHVFQSFDSLSLRGVFRAICLCHARTPAGDRHGIPRHRARRTAVVVRTDVAHR